MKQSISMASLKKKTPSISPKNHAQNSKNKRSLSIHTDENPQEHDNFMKKEELMLKILQPLNCDSLNKGKQFTELKDVFSSLIMISPTKNLSKVSEGVVRLNFSKKNKNKQF